MARVIGDDDDLTEEQVQELLEVLSGKRKEPLLMYMKSEAAVSKDLIKKARKEARMTQAEAGAVLSVPGNTWAGWELGRNAMKHDAFDQFLEKTVHLRRPVLKQPTREQIRMARIAAGLKQEEAAAIIGVTHSRWSHFESGIGKMSSDAWGKFLLTISNKVSV